MKKLFMMAAGLIVAAMVVVSCGKKDGAAGEGASNDSLAYNIDSLAYNIGVAQSEGLKQYALMQLGVDSAYLDDFVKGMKAGAKEELSASMKKKIAYVEGLKVGQQVIGMAENITMQVFADDSTKSIKAEKILAGLVNGLTGKETMSAMEAGEKAQNTMDEIMYSEYKKENAKYLVDNAKKDSVVSLPSGLQYRIIEEGNGALPNDSSVLKVHYEGKTIDGNVFDSSYPRNNPIEINMKEPGVIQGWVEALKLMPAGSKWEVVIPAELGYGGQNTGAIKPYSTLIFTIEVLK